MRTDPWGVPDDEVQEQEDVWLTWWHKSDSVLRRVHLWPLREAVSVGETDDY